MNSNRKNVRRLIVWLTFVAVILVGYAGFNLFDRSTQQNTPNIVGDTKPQTRTAAKQQRQLTSRLIIPKINVDSAILSVGLTESGNMDVPNNIQKTGWYKYGARPGATGTAVIAGHLNGPKNKKGVFINLDQLRVGDRVIVKDIKNKKTEFIVRETRTYGYTERPNEVFNSESGAHLNLITCSGAYDGSQNRYLDRLVVFTEKIDA